jgi:hypothetical protein
MDKLQQTDLAPDSIYILGKNRIRFNERGNT